MSGPFYEEVDYRWKLLNITFYWHLPLFLLFIWLQIWVKKRRLSRRNEIGQQEFDSLGATLLSAITEGAAVVFSLILIIWIIGGRFEIFLPHDI